MQIVTMLSDFGLRDPYVAEMKGVVLTVCPKAKIIDISHDVEKFNIRMGAFVLAAAAPFFPKGTVHVAVVDPGVGTHRRPIIVESERSLYVGPDNGLLILAARVEGLRYVYHVVNPQYMLPRISRTFHGRDIFAPVGGYLAKGIGPREFGPEISDYVKPSFAEPKVSRNVVSGEVLHIDIFGNIIANIPFPLLRETGIEDGSRLKVKIGQKMVVLKLCRAYGEVPAGAPLAIIGSGDLLEFSVNQGSASEFFRVSVGDSVRVSLAASSP